MRIFNSLPLIVYFPLWCGFFVFLIYPSNVCSLAFLQTRGEGRNVGRPNFEGKQIGIQSLVGHLNVKQLVGVNGKLASVTVKRASEDTQASAGAKCPSNCGMYLQQLFSQIVADRSKAPKIAGNGTADDSAKVEEMSSTSLSAPTNSLALVNGTDSVDPGLKFWCYDMGYLASLLLCYVQYCPIDFQTKGWEDLNGTCSGTVPSIDVFKGDMMQDQVIEITNFQALESGNTTTIEWIWQKLSVGLPSSSQQGGSEGSGKRQDEFNKILSWILYGLAASVLSLASIYTAISIYRTESIDFSEIKHVENQSTVSRHTFTTTTLSAVGSQGVKIWTWLRRKFILPAAFGQKHIEAVGWCTIPTRVQLTAVAFLIIINAVFLFLDQKSGIVSFTSKPVNGDIISYIANRAGFLALANLPIVYLTAGRNNFLIRMTRFSYGLFNVFHKWVGRIATCLAILHSILHAVGRYFLHQPHNEKYWWNGSAATILMTMIIVLAVYPMRKNFYEAFLVLHILGNILFIIFLYRHLELSKTGAYNPWIWACVALWGFERLARLIRIILLNTDRGRPCKHEAKIKLIKNTDIMKVSVYPSKTGVGFFPGAHYFLYIRSIKYWKFWESHPFTAVNWRDRGSEFINTNSKARHRPPWRIQRSGESTDAHARASPSRPDDWEKAAVLDYKGDGLSTIVEKSTLSMCKTEDMKPSRAKITFLIRVQDGMTRAIFKKLEGEGRTKLNCLIEGPYGSKHDLYIYDTVVTIAGGIGVSTTLAYLYDHLGRVKRGETMTKRFVFIWSVKQEEMITRLIRDSGLARVIKSVNETSGMKVVLQLFVTGEGEGREILMVTKTGSQSSRDSPSMGLRKNTMTEKEKDSRPGTARTAKGSPRQYVVGSRSSPKRSPSGRSRPNTANSRPNTANGSPGSAGKYLPDTTAEQDLSIIKPRPAYLKPGKSRDKLHKSSIGRPHTSGSSRKRPGTSGSARPCTSGSPRERPATSGSTRPHTSGSFRERPSTSGSKRPHTSGSPRDHQGTSDGAKLHASGSPRDRPGTSGSSRPQISGSSQRPATASTRPSTGTATSMVVPTTISERPETEADKPTRATPSKPEHKTPSPNQELSKRNLLEKEKEERYPQLEIIRARPNIEALLDREMKNLSGKMAILACGPGRMMDNTRKAVVECLERVGKKGDEEGANRVQYYEEAFSW